MSRVTICPSFFFINTELSPDIIERDYINPISNFLDQLDNHNIDLYLSADIMSLIFDQFPWNLYQDSNWKGYLNIWQSLLFSKINKKCKNLIGTLNADDSLNISCQKNSNEVNVLFSKFLNTFKNNKLLISGNFEEGIYIQNYCDSKSPFFNISQLDQLIQIEFPWLQVYDELLPPNGDYSFIPPSNWRKLTIIRGNQNGFIDIDKNEWCWDMLHKDHWDVQLANGSHKNVGPCGKILSKK